MLFLLTSHGDDADDDDADDDDDDDDDEGCDRTRTTIESSTRWFARARTRRTRTDCVVDEDARARVHETIGARRARRR